MTGIERAPSFEMERVLQGTQEFVTGKVYTYDCPKCHKKFRTDNPGEPVCTGPSETRDDHVHTKMLLFSLVNTDKVEKRPDEATAVARSESALWVPPGSNA